MFTFAGGVQLSTFPKSACRRRFFKTGNFAFAHFFADFSQSSLRICAFIFLYQNASTIRYRTFSCPKKHFDDKNIQFSPAELKNWSHLRSHAFYTNACKISTQLNFLNFMEFLNFKAYQRLQMEVFGPFTQVAPRSIGGALEV